MIKKTMIWSFITSFILFVIGILYIPFVIKDGFNDLILFSDEFTSVGEVSFDINDADKIKFFADEHTNVNVYTSINNKEITIEYRGIFTDNTSYSGQRDDNQLIISQETKSSKNDRVSTILNFAETFYDVDIFVPEGVDVFVLGQAYSHDRGVFDVDFGDTIDIVGNVVDVVEDVVDEITDGEVSVDLDFGNGNFKVDIS